jgi:transcriptional regulator GlxA family with amidase domain
MSSSVPTKYGLLLFPGFEVLDAAGPIEILNALTFHMDYEGTELSVIAPTKDLVSPDPKGQGKTSKQFLGQQFYQPTHSIQDAPPLDVLIVPGGRGTSRPDVEVKDILDFIRDSYNGSNGRQKLQYIFSICTGSDLLSRAGILDGEKATTNKMAWNRVTPNGPKVHWIAKARWVESGRAWTTSGVSAGIDGMAALMGRVYGEETAQKVCDFIEHNRIKDADGDPFADKYGVQDVLAH